MDALQPAVLTACVHAVWRPSVTATTELGTRRKMSPSTRSKDGWNLNVLCRHMYTTPSAGSPTLTRAERLASGSNGAGSGYFVYQIAWPCRRTSCSA